jgi:NTE family protein
MPLIVMATDLHARQEAAFSSGPLYPALAASIAIPGLFRPVAVDGRVLVDGGATNPLPFDRLEGLADVVVAVDVFGVPPVERSDVPGGWECVYTTINVMGGAIVAAKLHGAVPDLVIRPNVTIFRALDFYQASAILRAADAAKAELKDKLGELLSAAL